MSEEPELTEGEALAAEHALGVLTAGERADAEGRMARDPAFAASVEAWRARLGPLVHAIAPVEPSAGVWSAIARALPANDNIEALRRQAGRWRAAAIGSFGTAAASIAALLVLSLQPPTLVAPPEPGPLLNASLAGQSGGQPMFVAAYDPDRKALIVTSLMPAGSDPTHVHELWVIPADGKPHSLGMVEPGTSKRMPMPGDMAPMMTEGSALAVSVEPPGGSPTKDAPSGPVAASGKLSRI